MWENKFMVVHKHKTKKNDIIENTFPYFHSINFFNTSYSYQLLNKKI